MFGFTQLLARRREFGSIFENWLLRAGEAKLPRVLEESVGHLL